MSSGDTLVHATAVASAGSAVLITGPSGSGKSDLALRLIAWPAVGLGLQPFTLVSDDQVRLTHNAARLVVTAPDTIAGRIEVRGVGILAVAHTVAADLRLIVQLAPAETIERLPVAQTLTLAGMSLPAIRLYPFEPSAPVKVALALREILYAPAA